MPQTLHVYLVFLVQERALCRGSRVFSPSCGEVELEEDVIQNGDFVVVSSASFDNCFMEVSEIAIGLWGIIFRSWGLQSTKSFM